MKSLFLLVLLTVSAAAAEKTPVKPPAARAVAPRDFYVYACVREYSKAHRFPLFDSSIGYAVEYTSMDAEEMTRLYDAAKTFAGSLPAPQLEDEEHGGVPVLALCLEESRSARVTRLLTPVKPPRKPR